MTDPYRDSALDIPAEAPRDPGIVGDVIAQFADPKAFFRELVQNAIDAGSPNVEIKLEYEETAQRMRASVRDRGEGMTKEVVENQLLVLFRSTKEQDRTKIGKFGIGFMSVLSPNPEVVAVHTARDGRRLTLHLYRDLSYELFDAGPATQHGTTVELEIALAKEEVAQFVTDSEASLVRWCRHASVPIELAVRVPGDTSTKRIDRPLGIAGALVEVRRTTDDDQLTVVAAVTEEATPYLGFFNHGLMLYETPRPLLGCVSAKIQDARLGHTISRDDVRRDVHYDRAVEVARQVVREDLAKACVGALRQAAEAHDHEQHRKLLSAMFLSELPFDRNDLHFPIAQPVGGKRSVRVTELDGTVWTSQHATPLTEVLAAEGAPVLLSRDNNELAVVLGRTVRAVEHELTSITPIEHTDGDVALVALLGEIFDAVHRSPTGIVFATLAGARHDRLVIAGKHAELVHVVDRDEAARDPFALLRKRVVVLSVAHPQVRAARDGDPILAASHLARAVLLQHRLLTEARSRKIVEYALERVGVSR
ncbi:MAG TPA: ATP-binding protein [Kofleriaceae bacterium]